MIRGAVVVKPQAPAEGSWPPKTASFLSPAPTPDPLRPSDPWPAGGSSPIGAAGATHWVMPEANEGRRWFFRIHLSLVALIVVAVIVVVAFNAVSEASPLAPEGDLVTATGAPAAVSLPLRVGDCFDLATPNGDDVGDVTVRRCDESHQFELFLTYEVSALSYPVDSEWAAVYEAQCPPAFGEYVGTPHGGSVLDIYWLIPTRDGWHQGDHALQCAVYHPDIPRLTAPLKDSGRVGTGTDI